MAKHNIIPELAQRCSFAVALFHAFGHRIQCQVVYNPRYRTGFGLANGEGNERVWSLSRDLIASERVMGVSGFGSTCHWQAPVNPGVVAQPPHAGTSPEDGTHSQIQK
jgi:hypothetical protein